MLRYCYILLSYFIQPLVLLFMWRKGLKQPEYRARLAERYGFYGKAKQPAAKGVVIHAASVGEVIAATPLIKAIQVKYPNLAITVTTVTPTGSARVKAAFGNSVSHFYLPYDLPDAVERFIRFVDPKLMIVIETELWPTLIRKLRQHQIPFVLANARLSPRSAKRYGWVKNGIQNMLKDIALLLAQDNVSAERYLALGFPAEKLITTGNLKFDLEITDTLRNAVIDTAHDLNIHYRPVWIAGSTHEGEEKLVLEAHQRLLVKHPNLVLILVPRHPERFAEVEGLIQKSGLHYVKRTDNEAFNSGTQVLLGDTMGEMMLLYGLSNVAFVGGSLVKLGGHNPLEPIAFQLPVISGQYTYNFPEIFAKLGEVRGFIEVQSEAESLAQAVDFLLGDTNASKSIAKAGFSVLQENQGALARHLQHLAPYLEK